MESRVWTKKVLHLRYRLVPLLLPVLVLVQVMTMAMMVM
jgi:hypothetical protein